MTTGIGTGIETGTETGTGTGIGIDTGIGTGMRGNTEPPPEKTEGIPVMRAIPPDIDNITRAIQTINLSATYLTQRSSKLVRKNTQGRRHYSGLCYNENKKQK